MAYDQYAKIPQDLRPTQADAFALFELAYYIKEAAYIRHDFHTALQIEDNVSALRQAFVPALLRPQERPAERHLGAPPAWESGFARSYRPDAKTVAGLAAEHQRLFIEAKTIVANVRGNAKLGALLRNNIDKLISDIGYSASSGAVRRLRAGNASIINAFHPLGVEDIANIVNLILKLKQGQRYYW